MSDDRQDEVEATLPGGTKLRVRGYDFLTIAVVAGICIMAYVLWKHTEETAAASVAANQSLNVLAKEQRLTTCILATKEDQREAQYANPQSFCNRIAR